MVACPQSNSEAEVMNRTLLQGLNAHLGQAKGLWVEEPYHVLWAYQMTQRVFMGETPFKLAFRTEAIIPLEIGVPTLQVEKFEVDSNFIGLRPNLDLLEEIREQARIQKTNYQQQVAQYYNS